MDRVPFLISTVGPLEGDRWEVNPAGLDIGRETGCAVVLPDDGVSRQHARIHLQNGAVWVQDSGSRNGVFVNDKRVTRPKSVGPGDKISIGSHSFAIEVIEVTPDPTRTMTVTGLATPESGDSGRRIWPILLVVAALITLVIGAWFLVP